MSATPANDVQTPSAWNYAPNIQHFFELGIEKIKKNAKCNLVWGIIIKNILKNIKIISNLTNYPIGMDNMVLSNKIINRTTYQISQEACRHV